MRFLSLGYEFRSPKVENAAFRSSVSALDFASVIWDPERTLEGYSGYPEEYQGLPAFREGRAQVLAADLARRKAEFVDFLGLGRTLVIITPAPCACMVETDTEYSGTGRNRQTIHMYSRLDLLASVSPVNFATQKAAGHQVDLVAGEPFAAFWRRMRPNLLYRAYFTKTPGTPLFVVSETKKAVGAYVGAHGGNVLLLPVLGYASQTASERGRVDVEFCDALEELIGGLGESPTALPAWAHELRVGGEDAARAAVLDLEQQVQDAADRRDIAAARLAEIEAVKALVTETGKPLEKLVRKAFEGLGCRTEDGDPGRTEFVLRWGRRTAVVEVKGVAKSAKEADSAQLEKWVSEQFAKEGKRPKGLLIVNGFKDTPLPQREAPVFPNQMLKYAVSREHCLLSSTQLLCAELDVVEHPERAKQVMASIFAAVGVYPGYLDWRQFLLSQGGSDN